MKKSIAQIGESVIRTRAMRVVNPKSKTTKKHITRLLREMRKEGLVGIAAPQINVGQRIFITYPRSTKYRVNRNRSAPVIYINPRIIKRSRAQNEGFEGCGSVAHAGIFGRVKRSKSVTIKAQDSQGNWFTHQAHDFLARIIQHEYDHLEGIIFLDRVKHSQSFIGRETYIRRGKSIK